MATCIEILYCPTPRKAWWKLGTCAFMSKSWLQTAVSLSACNQFSKVVSSRLHHFWDTGTKWGLTGHLKQAACIHMLEDNVLVICSRKVKRRTQCPSLTLLPVACIGYSDQRPHLWDRAGQIYLPTSPRGKSGMCQNLSTHNQTQKFWPCSSGSFSLACSSRASDNSNLSSPSVEHAYSDTLIKICD